MPGLNESLRHIFSVLDNFLNVTLRNESLGKTAEKERSKVTALIKKLYSDYEDLNPNPSPSKRKSIFKDSKQNSASSAEGSFNYPDSDLHQSPNEFAPTTVKTLANPIKIGFLQMKSMGSKQKPYCVLHKNTLYWFSKPSDKQQEGAISVTDYEFKSDEKKIAKKNFTFALVSPGKKPLQFVADSKDDLELWQKAFATAHEYKEEILQHDDEDDDGLTYFEEAEDQNHRELPSPPKESEDHYINVPVYSLAETLDDEATYINVIHDENENIYDTVGS